MGEKTTLGNFIATRRKHMQLTQEELAGRIGVSKSAVAKWETDGGLPDRDNLKRLSDTLQVTVDELHRVIRNADAQDADLHINITPDVIATLESYGYQVIRPGTDRKNGGKEYVERIN